MTWGGVIICFDTITAHTQKPFRFAAVKNNPYLCILIQKRINHRVASELLQKLRLQS